MNTEPTLDTLMHTIREHARALVDKEWYRDHNEPFLKMLVAAELYDLNRRNIHESCQLEQSLLMAGGLLWKCL